MPNKPNYTRVIVNYDPLEDRRIDINLLIYPMNQVDSSGGSRHSAEAFLPSAILFFFFLPKVRGGEVPRVPRASPISATGFYHCGGSVR